MSPSVVERHGTRALSPGTGVANAYPEETPVMNEGSSAVSATFTLRHNAIGVEVRRRPYDVMLDGERVGSVSVNDTFAMSIEAGRHTVQVRSGRNSSRVETFDAADGTTIAFRCTGKSFLPIFLASFVVPSLALRLKRE
jgi:hypothetical protein